MTQISTPTEWDDYRFDLEGYLVLKNAVSSELLEEINETIDGWLALQAAGHRWIGQVRCNDGESTQGPDCKFANILENCGNFNVLVALSDIGPGNGGTVIVPGSHKCNLINPLIFKEYSAQSLESERRRNDFNE